MINRGHDGDGDKAYFEQKRQEWKKELLRRIDLDDDLDEKYAKGVYDMALDITEKVYRIFANNNDLNDIGDTYFPDAEIACYIYDAIKYGRF